MVNLKNVHIKKGTIGFGFSLEDEGRPFGISVLVTQVAPGGPADLSGLKVGDLVTAVNQVPVQSMTYLEVSNLILSNSENTVQLSVITNNKDRVDSIVSSRSGSAVATTRSNDTSDPVTYTKESETNTDCRLSSETSAPELVQRLSSLQPTNIQVSPPSSTSVYQFLRPIPKPRRSIITTNRVIPVRETDVTRTVLVELAGPVTQTSSINTPPADTRNYTLTSTNNNNINGNVGLNHSAVSLPSENDNSGDHKENSSLSSDQSLKSDDDNEIKSNKTVSDNPNKHMRLNRIPSFKEDEEGSHTIRFVRKRAYASARCHGSVNAFTVANQHHTSPDAKLNDSLNKSQNNTSPCQLLPAAPMKSAKSPTFHSSSGQPKVIHLPKRQSSNYHSMRLTNREAVQPLKHQQKRPFHTSLSLSECTPTPKGSQIELQSNKSSIQELPPANRNASSKSNSRTSGPLSSRFWASFDQDSDVDIGRQDGSPGFWVYAGEMYHHLCSESKRLADKQHRQPTRNSNVYDPVHKCRDSQHPYTTNQSESVHSNKIAVNGSKTLAEYDNSPTMSHVNYAVNDSPATRPWQFLKMCSGLLSYRSESNVLCDTSRSFLSRQCFCKIITVDRGDNKKYSWRPYYMCVTNVDVRFIKASSGFIGSGRWQKAKNAPLSNPIHPSLQSSDTVNVVDSPHDTTPSTPTNPTDLMTNLPTVIRSSHSCLNLPIPGLIWRHENLPQDFPEWHPLGSTSGNSGGIAYGLRSVKSVNQRPIGVVGPDWMDPQCSGLSNTMKSDSPSYMVGHLKSVPTSSETNTPISRSSNRNVRSHFRCYRFAHITAGAELLCVFPDENSAMASLKLCQLGGGCEVESSFISNSTGITSDFSSLSGNVYSTHEGQPQVVKFKPSNRYSRAANLDEPSLNNKRSVSAEMSDKLNHTTKLDPGDRRQRRCNHSTESSAKANYSDATSTKSGYHMKSYKSDEAKAFWSRTRSKLCQVSIDQMANEQDSTNIQLSTDSNNNNASQQSTAAVLSERSNKLIRGIKQLFNRPNVHSNSNESNNSCSQIQVISLPESGLNNATQSAKSRLSLTAAEKVAIVKNLTPNGAAVLFGAPLEKQLQSPDFPGVPLLLQLFFNTLEIHGLHSSGLYRKPGRQRTLEQFVASATLSINKIDTLLDLPAWEEPNAICGLVKCFLRRLPVGLIPLSSWEPLACMVPDSGTFKSSSTSSLSSSDNSLCPSLSTQLAYLLLSVRTQLKKMALEAFVITGSNTDKNINPVNSPSDYTNNALDFEDTATANTSHTPSSFDLQLSPCSPMFYQCSNPVHNASSFPVWRWATLCYLIQHIRTVVSYEKYNAISFQCIAICFGPVFFIQSLRMLQMNQILEQLFRHWDWLIDGLPLVTEKSFNDKSVSNFVDSIPERNLEDAVDYLSSYESCTNVQSCHAIADNHSVVRDSGRLAMQTVQGAHSNQLQRNCSGESLDKPDAQYSKKALYEMIRSLVRRATTLAEQAKSSHSEKCKRSPQPSVINTKPPPVPQHLTIYSSDNHGTHPTNRPHRKSISTTRKLDSLHKSQPNADSHSTTGVVVLPNNYRHSQEESITSQSNFTTLVRRPTVPQK